MGNFKYHIFALCCLLLSFPSCEKNNTDQEQEKLVIEGWIDEGGYPMVLLHKTYVLNMNDDPRETKLVDVIENQLIAFGKVVISDGTEEVVLTGHIDTTYMPPTLYTTTRMMGEAGKTYTIEASYKDLQASSYTSIPVSPQIDSLTVKAVNQTHVEAKCFISNVPMNERAYYVCFMRYLADNQYKVCPLGCIDNSQAKDGKLDFLIYNPLELKDSTLSKPIFGFLREDAAMSYVLKVARVDKTCYDFWEQFAERSMLQGVLFIPIFKNIPTNIEGGYGIWCGMGAATIRFQSYKDATYPE